MFSLEPERRKWQRNWNKYLYSFFCAFYGSLDTSRSDTGTVLCAENPEPVVTDIVEDTKAEKQ